MIAGLRRKTRRLVSSSFGINELSCTLQVKRIHFQPQPQDVRKGCFGVPAVSSQAESTSDKDGCKKVMVHI